MALFEPAVVLLQQVFGLLTPLITTPLIASRAGIEALGLYAATLAASQYMRYIVEYGFELSTPRQLSRSDSLEDRSDLFWTTLRAKAALAAISGSAVALYVLTVVEVDSIRFALGAVLFGVGLGLNPIWMLRAVGSTVLASTALLISRVVAVVLMFALLRGPETAGWAVLSIGLAQFGYLVIALLDSARHFPWRYRRAQGRRIVSTLWTGREGLLLKVGQAAFVSQPGLILALGSPTGAAVYSVGERVMRAPSAILVQLIQYAYPAVVRRSGSPAFGRSVRLLLVGSVTAGAVVPAVGYFLADDVARILGVGDDPAFARSIQLSLVAFVPWLVSQVLGWFYLSARGRDHYFARSVALGGAAATAITLVIQQSGTAHPNLALVIGEGVTAAACTVAAVRARAASRGLESNH